MQPNQMVRPHQFTRADMEAFARRTGPGPGPMIPPSAHAGAMPQVAAQQALAAQRASAEKREDAKNRSQKPVDRNMPDLLGDLVSSDGLARYKKMQAVEHKLDAIMMRKRLDMQESVYRDIKSYGTMRIWISNTCENQSWQFQHGIDAGAFDYGSGIEPTYRVKIEGRLLDDAEAREQDGEGKDGADEKDEQDNGGSEGRAAKRQKMSPPPQPPSTNNRQKLSHFFRSITIDFDRAAKFQPDGYTAIEWRRPDMPPHPTMDVPKEADFDRLEFERKADENMNVTANLRKDEFPERYRLSTKLAELLDMEEADRDTVLMGIWEYIKLAGVRMDDERRQIYCDQRMIDVFGTESIYFPSLPQMILEKGHLTDLPPISLPYTIRVDKAFHTSSDPNSKYTIYDIRVPLSTRNHSIPLDPAALRSINALDDSLALVVAKITASQAKHKFLSNLKTDPANFVKRWTASQRRDLDVITGKGPWAGADDEWQNAEWRNGAKSSGEPVWGSREAHEGVGMWLTKEVERERERARAGK